MTTLLYFLFPFVSVIVYSGLFFILFFFIPFVQCFLLLFFLNVNGKKSFYVLIALFFLFIFASFFFFVWFHIQHISLYMSELEQLGFCIKMNLNAPQVHIAFDVLPLVIFGRSIRKFVFQTTNRIIELPGL